MIDYIKGSGVPDKKSPTQILILEDNIAVASRLCKIIKDSGMANVVGSCLHLRDALHLIENTQIDLLVADLQLPDGSGITAIEAMTVRWPESQSIVVSALNERPTVIKALRAGATGYILKDDTSVDILAAIEAVLDGQSPISTAIARYLIELVAPVEKLEKSATNAPKLTSREYEILSIIAKGFTNREVSDFLGISINTVPVHIRNIYKKLQASNRSEAMFEAHRLGILKY